MEEMDISDTLSGYSEKKKEFLKIKKEREGHNTHTFNVSFSKIENPINFLYFHLYPLTSINNDLHSYCILLIKMLRCIKRPKKH